MKPCSYIFITLTGVVLAACSGPKQSVVPASPEKIAQVANPLMPDYRKAKI
jgi:PBP1b-binding outer membrane lipoprotein LpoB